MENVALHSLLIRKMIVLPILGGRMYFLKLGVNGLTAFIEDYPLGRYLHLSTSGHKHKSFKHFWVASSGFSRQIRLNPKVERVMDIILRNYDSRSSVVREDGSNSTSAKMVEISGS